MPINSLASFTPPTIPNQDEAEAAAQSANDATSSPSGECDSAAPSGAQAAASGSPIAPVDKAGAHSGGQQGGAQEHGGADGGNPFKSLQRIPGFEQAVLTTQIARATQVFQQKQAQALAQLQPQPQPKPQGQAQGQSVAQQAKQLLHAGGMQAFGATTAGASALP